MELIPVAETQVIAYFDPNFSRTNGSHLIMTKILVLLIEDNRILREGISAMLAEYGNFSVTTVADGGKSSLTKARAIKPHVALIDFSLATNNSVDIVASLRKEF